MSYNKEAQKKWRDNHKEDSKRRREEFFRANPNYRKEWRAKNQDSMINQRLEYLYGISLVQYEKMLLDQKGVCAVCLKPETRVCKGKISRLAVDHNHQTGKVRKLLCYACNTSLGLLEEDTTRIRNLAKYVEDNNVNS